MRRRWFNHLALEISVRVGRPVPRYSLWLRLHEAGIDPERLSRRDALRFCDEELRDFLASEGAWISQHSWRTLRRDLARFDAGSRTAEEWAASFEELP